MFLYRLSIDLPHTTYPRLCTHNTTKSSPPYRPQQEAAALKRLTKADVQSFYDTYIRSVFIRPAASHTYTCLYHIHHPSTHPPTYNISIGGPARRLLTAQVYPSHQRKLLKQPLPKGKAEAEGDIDDELAFRRSRPVYGEGREEGRV